MLTKSLKVLLFLIFIISVSIFYNAMPLNSIFAIDENLSKPGERDPEEIFRKSETRLKDINKKLNGVENMSTVR